MSLQFWVKIRQTEWTLHENYVFSMLVSGITC